METSSTCGNCGTPLHNGLCPRCQLDVALLDDLDADLNEKPGFSATQPVLSRLGDYELLEELGRGGMGIVYRARQVSLNRLVALKLLPFSGRDGTNVSLRLRAEAVSAGSLRHPNIVAIHEVGLQQGQHFLVMDLVRGPSLAQVLRDGPLPSQRAVTLVRQVALAVQHAHDHGIIHRDLKPSNILMELESDQPHVTDFGLAKNLYSDTQLTLTGQILGSPNYIPPEQIHTGEVASEPQVTPFVEEKPRNRSGTSLLPATRTRSRTTFQSDVYSLGAVLYHALTSRPPFQAESIPAVFRQVLDEEPVAPRKLNPSVPVDLDTICVKCLQKAQSDRYQSAQELADDLGRFLRGEPVHVRPLSSLERGWRWCKRKPALATAVSLALFVLLLVGLGAPVAAFRIDRERQRAIAAAKSESELRIQAEAERYTSDMNLVLEAWEGGNLPHAQDLLRAHIPKPGGRDIRGFEWRYLNALCQDESQLVFTNLSGPNLMAGLLTNPRVLAVANDNTIKLLNTDALQEIDELRDVDADIVAAAISPTNPGLVATLGRRSGLKVWNLDTKRPERESAERYDNSFQAITFSPNGRFVAATGTGANAVELWDVERQTQVWSINTHLAPATVAFSLDSSTVLTAGGAVGNILAWDVLTGESVPFPEKHRAWVNHMAFSGDGKLLASASNDGTIIIWDFASRAPLTTLTRAGMAGPTAFSADNRTFAAGGEDGAVRLWDVRSWEQIRVLRGHLSAIRSLAFTPDSQSIITTSSDREVRVFAIQGRPSRELAGNASTLFSVTFSPNGKTLAATDYHKNRVQFWDVEQRKIIRTVEGEPGNEAGVGLFSPDGRYFALGGYSFSGSSQASLWDATSFQERATFKNNFQSGLLTFSPDSRILAIGGGSLGSGGNRKQLAFWDIAADLEINWLPEATINAAVAAFSNDGKLLAVSYFDGSVKLWDFQAKRLLATFPKVHTAMPWSLSFSHDNTWIATGGSDSVVGLYEVSSKRSFPLREHFAEVWCVCFAPDDRTLVSSSGDATIKFWNLTTRRSALTLKDHSGPVSGVAFNRQGTLMASVGWDGLVRLRPTESSGISGDAQRGFPGGEALSVETTRALRSR